MSPDPRSWFYRIVGACLAILVGALALDVAVKMIESIWSTLLLILGGGLLVAYLVAAWRARSRGW